MATAPRYRRPPAALAGLLVLLLAPAGAAAQILGTPQANDLFGYALATGDFDGDGLDDLAVGVYRDRASGEDGAGAVNVLYGHAGGLADPRNQLWHEDSPGVLGTGEPFDFFGAAVAAGDFDGDGFDDLAIGVIGQAVLGEDDAGAVSVLYGGPDGLSGDGSQVWTHNHFTGQTAEAGDVFGSALAAGDFDGDGYDDLAVGIPGEDAGAVVDGGAVQVVYGTAAGLSAAGSQRWTQATAGAGTNDAGDYFGSALAVGDFDGDGFDDLAVGVPYETVDGQNNAGAAVVLYGTGGGLSSDGSQLWSQDPPDVPGVPEPFDFFGSALAVGDFDGDGRDDLAVGVPGKDLSLFNVENIGAANVIYGSNAGLVAAGSQLWIQESEGVPGGSEEDDRFGNTVAAGDFDDDGYDDLAIGVRNEDDGAGSAIELYGSAAGLTGDGSQLWMQGLGGLLGEGEPDEHFSAALATGDFDGDGRDDLAVSAPNEAISGALAAGVAHTIYGSAGGLAADGNQYLHQGAALPVAAAPGAPAPAALALAAPYPNPATGALTLAFTLPAPGPARLAVYDALGRTVAVVLDGVLRAGAHAVGFDAGALPAGVYLVRLEAGGEALTRRLTRLR